MAIAYHTHTFTIPTADAADITAGTVNDEVVTPAVLGPITAAGKMLMSAADAAAQRAALDLEPGADVQAYSANLDKYAAVNPTAAGLAFLDDADASAQRTTLGLAIGTDVQAYDADLSAIAALAKTDGNFIVGDGSTWTVESGATARSSLGLGSAAVADLIDDDTMATATATNIASAESVTAYVDARQRRFATITALKASGATFTNGEYIYVEGRAAAHDGGGGLFRYSSADLSTTFVRQTISVLTGEINAGTNKISQTAHGLHTGQACIVTGGDGLTANTTVYYIRGRLPNEYTLHPTYEDAVAATNTVDITGTTAFSIKVLVDPDQVAYVTTTGDALDGSEGGFMREEAKKRNTWEVEWFPGSGSTDTGQIKRAIYAAGVGGTVVFPRDTLTITNHDTDDVCLWRLSGQTWRGDREYSIIQLSSATTDTQYVIRDYGDASDCVMEDLTIDGNRANITPGVGVNLYSDFNLVVGPEAGNNNVYRRLNLINSWGRTLQTGWEAGSTNTTNVLVEHVKVLNSGTKAISATETTGCTIKDCYVEVNAYTAAENPAGKSASSGSCYESNFSQDVIFRDNIGKQVDASVKGPGIRIINGGSSIKAIGNVIEDASYLGFIQNCDDVEFAHNTGRNINGNAILISDDDTANPTDGCERIRVHHNKIIDPTGAYVAIVANKNGYDVAVEAYIYENDFIKDAGSPTHGIYNNGVAAPATGGTCIVRQWNNNFVGGVPNEIAGPADFEVLPSPGAGWVIVDQSAVSVAHTGDTSETILASISVLPHHMGKNGRLRVTAVWDYTNSANNKITRVRFGGSQAYAATLTTTAQNRAQIELANKNATNSQGVLVAGVTSGWGTTTTAASTLSIDTTATATMTITGQLASSGETVTLESYLVEAYHEN